MKKEKRIYNLEKRLFIPYGSIHADFFCSVPKEFNKHHGRK